MFRSSLLYAQGDINVGPCLTCRSSASRCIPRGFLSRFDCSRLFCPHASLILLQPNVIDICIYIHRLIRCWRARMASRQQADPRSGGRFPRRCRPPWSFPMQCQHGRTRDRGNRSPIRTICSPRRRLRCSRPTSREAIRTRTRASRLLEGRRPGARCRGRGRGGRRDRAQGCSCLHRP